MQNAREPVFKSQVTVTEVVNIYQMLIRSIWLQTDQLSCKWSTNWEKSRHTAATNNIHHAMLLQVITSITHIWDHFHTQQSC